MGQCSTLPADKNGKSENGRNTMSPTTHSRRSYKQQREEREPYHEEDSRRQADGDVVMGGEQYSPSPRASRRDVRHMVNSAKETNSKFETYMEEHDSGSHYNSGNSSKSSGRGKRASSSSRVASATREDFFPPPPEGSVRTRCYRLNLDVPAVLSPTHDSLGPFHYTAPSHLLSNYGSIAHSMSTESVEKSSTQIAVDTARIFRGIKVDNNGTIVGRNDRASRSRRTQNTSKTAENSRQSAKINKANDLVDEMVASGKENDGQKVSMISIIPIGEYDDMKQLVREGSKNLREAEFKGDEAILALNRPRASPRSRRSGSLYPSSPSSTSRRKISVNSQQQYAQDMPSTPRSSSSASRSKSRSRRSTPGSAPPKLKSHPRDRPSSRRMDVTRSDERNQKCNTSLFGGGDSDWSEALNFNSIWNCGGTGTGTMSPSNNGGGTPSNARSNKIYEGRNESNTRFSRGISERDAPLIL